MRYRTLLASCFLFNMVTCSPLLAQVLVVGGTGTDLGTFRLLAEAFKADYPNTDTPITILPSMGSSGGIKALKHQKINLALTSRPLKNSERSAELKAVHYATTPLVFAVATTSPQQGVTREQILQIYNGSLKHWPDGSPARPILRPSQDSDTKTLIKTLVDCTECFMQAYQRRGLPIAMTDQQSADLIAQVPGAVGTSTLSLILAENKPIKVLNLDGIAPTADNLLNKTYPMYKKLYLVYNKHSKLPGLNAFIDFIYSKKGQSILLNTGHLTIR